MEPKGDSDTFIVHGSACLHSEEHPTCTHDAHSKAPPSGRSYTIDITDVMGSDLAVRFDLSLNHGHWILVWLENTISCPCLQIRESLSDLDTRLMHRNGMHRGPSALWRRFRAICE